jgi:hypothetical protein
VFVRRRTGPGARHRRGPTGSGGTFNLVYEPPDADQAEPMVRVLSALLDDHGSTVTDVLVEDLSTARIGSVIATAARS